MRIKLENQQLICSNKVFALKLKRKQKNTDTGGSSQTDSREKHCYWKNNKLSIIPLLSKAIKSKKQKKQHVPIHFPPHINNFKFVTVFIKTVTAGIICCVHKPH